ncbi:MULTISPECIES: adenylate/guanylate cyclase domain-containing protein [unclassified Leptolyngbya]|nr:MULTISPECIES: adenylate/guanylate cyclase domain-containing protein [unclassified Leptolyngbya]
MAYPIDDITRYIPNLIIDRFQDASPSLEEAFSDTPVGAMLMADISGFTALSERLAEQGPEGAEVLTHILNGIFERLEGLIASSGGDVLHFAGDALYAFWPIRDGADRSAVVAIATQCAIDAQHVLADFAASEGRSISMRIGVGVGSLTVFHVGGIYRKWHYMVRGDAVEQVCLAQDRAQRGEVILSPEASELAQSNFLLEPKTGGYARVIKAVTELVAVSSLMERSPAQNIEALRAYIPSVLLARAAAGQAAYMSELRRVTTLFISLAGFHDDAELSLIQTVVQDIQTALNRREGTLNKLSVDEKGVYIIAALGLPPLAHKDDPTRGVQVALDIHAQLDRLGVRHAIGVTTGKAFCGVVGGDKQRCEYTVIGASINLAVRLMQAAIADPNSQVPIFCCDNTHRATRELFVYQKKGPIRVKGKNQSVSVYVPLREQLQRPQISDIVGRLQERNLLKEAVKMLAWGKGTQTIVIEGEAGVGKSRLTQEFCRMADEEGVVTLRGVGDAVEKNVPYHGWRGILTHLFALERGATLEMHREQVLNAVGPALADDVSLLNDILPLEFPEADVALEGPARAAAIRALVLSLLKASAERTPTTILIEDAHWLDSASWQLLEDAIEDVNPLLVVVATRAVVGPQATTFRQLLDREETTHVRLQDFDQNDTGALVAQRLGVTQVPTEVVSFVHSKSRGNPFFAEELTYAIREAKLLDISDKTCRLREEVSKLDDLGFPDTVQGVVLGRIDGLDPEHQMALKVASVIGRVFAISALSQIHPILPEHVDLGAVLGELEQLEMTPLYRNDPEPEYIFKHLITQDVAYNLLLYKQRRELHRATAMWYEEHHAKELAPYYSVLAHHYQQAEDSGKALQYAILAGDRAMRIAAYTEAEQRYAQAIEMLNSLEEGKERNSLELQLRMKQANPLVMTQGYQSEQVRIVYERARALCQDVGNIPDMHTILRGLWSYYLFVGPLETCRDIAEQCNTIADNSDDDGLKMEAAGALGNTLFWLGQLKLARSKSSTLDEIYERGDAHKDRVHRFGMDPYIAFSTWISWGDWILGYPDSSLARAKKALAIARNLDHPFSVAQALQTVSWVYICRHEFAQAREVARAMLNLAKEKELGLWIVLGNILWGRALVGLGDFDTGLPMMKEGIAGLRDSGACLGIGFFSMLLTQSLLDAEDLDGAFETIDQGLDDVQTYGEGAYIAELYRLKGEVLLSRDGTQAKEQARSLFHKAWAIAQAQEARSFLLRIAMSLYRLGDDPNGTQLTAALAQMPEGKMTYDQIEARKQLDS